MNIDEVVHPFRGQVGADTCLDCGLFRAAAVHSPYESGWESAPVDNQCGPYEMATPTKTVDPWADVLRYGPHTRPSGQWYAAKHVDAARDTERRQWEQERQGYIERAVAREQRIADLQKECQTLTELQEGARKALRMVVNRAEAAELAWAQERQAVINAVVLKEEVEQELARQRFGLITEVEYFKRQSEERYRLLNEKTKEASDDWHRAEAAEIEVARLRTALRYIADGRVDTEGHRVRASNEAQIAREALAGTQESKS
jgi:hypothetical protein